MNYQKVYNSIIESAKKRNSAKGGDLILERHHIIPKSCGGSNSKTNLVNLTLREHFICHLLLTKIYKNTEHHHKLVRAAFLMTRGANTNSKAYLKVKEYHIRNLKLQVLTEEHKSKISDAHVGKKLSEEHKYKLREVRLGTNQKPRSQETKEKIRQKLIGKPKSEEWKKKISESLIGKQHSEDRKKKISESLKGKIRGSYKKKTTN